MVARRPLTAEMRKAILMAQNGMCAAHCERPDLLGGERPFEIDHVRALSLGGGDTRENLQALCVECHALKTARDRREHARIREAARAVQQDEDRCFLVQLQARDAAPPSTARKRKRHHARGEMRQRAVPLLSHPECEKWKRRIRACGRFDQASVDAVANNLRYYKCYTDGRAGADHYFFSDVVNSTAAMRGAREVAEAFLRAAGSRVLVHAGI